MKHLDLFSGIGGFALAAKWNGIETFQFVEIDPFCQKVLNKNFPGVPIHEDITTYNHSGDSPFILTGGFPCQPFSCAGKRRGKEDNRYLWPEMLRVISEARPTWVLGENVPGIINMELDKVLSDLEDKGYEVQTLIIPACAVDAPHRRYRVWVVASNATSNGIGKIGSVRKGEDTITGRVCQTLADTSDKPEPQTDSSAFSIRGERNTRDDANSCDRGREPGDCRWITEPNVGRVANGIPSRVDRLKGLGNAIVPQVAAEIIRCIVDTDRNTGNGLVEEKK